MILANTMDKILQIVYHKISQLFITLPDWAGKLESLQARSPGVATEELLGGG